MRYLVYKPTMWHPQVGFEIGLGKGVNEVGDIWYLAKYVGEDEIVPEVQGAEMLVIGIDADEDVLLVAPWVKDIKSTQIRAWGASRLTVLAGHYFKEERETWELQRLQALELKADPNAPARMLRAMAQTRQVPLDLMAAKVLENYDLFEPLSGHILGTQQRLLDLVWTPGVDLETIMNITWPE